MFGRKLQAPGLSKKDLLRIKTNSHFAQREDVNEFMYFLLNDLKVCNKGALDQSLLTWTFLYFNIDGDPNNYPQYAVRCEDKINIFLGCTCHKVISPGRYQDKIWDNLIPSLELRAELKYLFDNTETTIGTNAVLAELRTIKRKMKELG